MEYVCSVCKEKIKDGPGVYIDHTEKHIVDMIMENHPDWEENGVCEKCYEYYKKELKGQ